MTAYKTFSLIWAIAWSMLPIYLARANQSPEAWWVVLILALNVTFQFIAHFIRIKQ